MADIIDETSLDTAIAAANGGTATTGTFQNSVTETAPPTEIAPADATLTLDGAGYTLTGDGVAGALRVGTDGSTFPTTATTAAVTIENLNIANTGSAQAIADYGAVTFDNDGTTTASRISGVIGGVGSVTLASTGEGATTVIFDAANTYTGATVINGAGNTTLELGVNGSIATSASVEVDAGTLDISSVQTSTGGVENVVLNDVTGSNGYIQLGANTAEVTETQSGAASTYDGVFQGTGGLQVDQGGTLTLSNNYNTYTGSTKIYGALDLTGIGSIEESSNVSLKTATAVFDISSLEEGTLINELTGVAGSQIHLGGNALTVDEDGVNASFSGVISGGGSLTVEGPDTLTLAGANTFTGGLTVGSDSDGDVVLSGANTYSGGTTVNSGSTLTVVAGGSLGTGTTTVDGTLDVSAVATGAVAVTNLNGEDSDATVLIGSNKLVDATTSSYAFDGTISGAGALQVGTSAVSGELTLSGDGSIQAYTGSTIIYSELVLDGTSIENSSNVSLKAAGAVFDVSGGYTDGTFTETIESYDDYYYNGGQTSFSDTFNGVLINELTGVAGTQVHLGVNTLIVNETTNATFTGVISDDGSGSEDGSNAGDDEATGVSLVVRGSATLSLAGANTYYGDTVIKGHLDLIGGGSISNSYVSDYNVFDVSGATPSSTDISGNPLVTIQGLQGANANATVVLGGNTLEITGTPSNNEVYSGAGYGEAHAGIFEGVISGTGGLELTETTGDAYLALTNVSTYTGATTITAGELELFGSASIASSSAIIDNGDFDTYEAGLTLSTVISGGGDIYFGESYNLETGAFSAGSVTISAADTFTGYIEVGGSVTLTLAAGGSIAGASEVYLDGAGDDEYEGYQATTGAVFDISQASGNVSIGSLGGDTGTSVTLGSNSLIITGPADDSFYGVISGAGGVQVAAGGELYFAAAQTYTGSTVVTGYLELFDDATSLASSNVSVKTGGTFDISGVGGLVTINELTGQTGTHVDLGDSTLAITETLAATYSGVIQDGGFDEAAGGGLTVGGSAYLTLAGVNTYTGTTTITGDLAIGSGGSIADSSGVVDNGFLALGTAATVNNLSGDGVLKMVTFGLTDTVTTDETFSGVIHGASALTVAGTAGDVLTLSGASSDYSGGTMLTGATLELSALHAAGSGAIVFADASASGAVLQLDNAALTGGGSATESFANSISGLSANDTIDLSGLSYVTSQASQIVTVTTAGQVVITEGNVSVTLHVSDATVGESFTLSSDGHTGTDLMLTPTVSPDFHTHM